MTNETEYGPEIVVDGVRPVWLRDDEKIKVVWLCNGFETFPFPHSDFPDYQWEKAIKAIRLPATHGYYQVSTHNAKHGTQFKYWPGGAEPDDWNAGEVLLRNGNFAGNPVRWTNLGWPGDIIGYTPKPCADTDIGNPISSGPTTEKDAVVQSADFVPCERTVRHVAAMVEDWSNNALSSETSRMIAAVAKDILLNALPKKDRAAELVEAICENAAMSSDRMEGVRFAVSQLIQRGDLS